MIPPVVASPGQANEIQNMVGWKNTFNMRQVTLMNLAASNLGVRNTNKLNIPYHRKMYSITSPTQSLDILRKNLQSAINKDIENVIKKYLEKFFQPAIINIKNNLGKDSVNEDHIKEVCQKMLDEAKSIYKTNSISRDSSPYDFSDSETSINDGRNGRSSPNIKRKESDTDSETNSRSFKRIKRIYDYSHKNIKRDAPKWDPERINENTLFIMGARANKVLGYGQTRGRLYVRHPELVKYSGDQEDKEWLAAKNLMPPSGGKAYLMILNDIKELSESDEYKNNPNLQLQELKGFEVPHFLISKIKLYMEKSRTDKKSSLDFFDFSGQSPGLGLDSPSTPSDTIQLVESQPGSTSSKHSDFVHIPETSPSSNHSVLSGTMAHSPLPTSRSLLSPNMLLAVTNNDGCSDPPVMVLKENTQNGSSLSSILAQHFSNESGDEF